MNELIDNREEGVDIQIFEGEILQDIKGPR